MENVRDNNITAPDNPPGKSKRGQPRKFKTAKDLQDSIDGYWKWLIDNGRTSTLNKRGDTACIPYPPYWTRLLLHIGLNDSTATPYINGEYDDDINNYSEVLSRARATVESLIVEGAMRGEVSDKIAALTLAHHHGIVQRQEISQTTTHVIELQPADWEAMERRVIEARERRLAIETSATVVDSAPVDT